MALCNTTTEDSGSADPHISRDQIHYILISVLSFTLLLFMMLGIVFLRRYRSLVKTIQDLRRNKFFYPRVEVPIPARPVSVVEAEVVEEPAPQTPLQHSSTFRSSTKKLWKGLQQSQTPGFNKSDLNLLQLIKAGKEGVFYQARMTRGTCKGHSMLTCKISKEGVRLKHVDMEVSIMKKLMHHKNILQLLDWNTTAEPYILIMEYVSYGTLRTFLQTNRVPLVGNPELQSLLTIASYHIALAMQHLRSKMIMHCDLALRNIMVNKFPWEVKVAEFGLARDLSRMTSRRSTHLKNSRSLSADPQPANGSAGQLPENMIKTAAGTTALVPPEYFKSNYYGFKGDVWAFGIVLWEMQSFGALPYPNLETSEEVIYHVCMGHKNTNPEGCRPEILHIMRDCWQDPHTLRPAFTDIVSMLEDIMENDADYVDVVSPQSMVKDEAEYQEAKSRRTASVNDDKTPV